MDSAFFSRRQLAEWFGCGEGRAQRMVEAQGLKGIDFGAGRNGGLHWRRDAVMEAFTHNGPVTVIEAHNRPHAIKGKSLKQLQAELCLE